MSGLPVSHIGHKVAGSVITTGSPNVFVGSAAVGQADRPSACSPATGQPVNPMLGVKLLPGEVDFSLPAPAPFAFVRTYVSSNTCVGSLGQGWSLPAEGLGLDVSDDGVVLIDSQGRRIQFPALPPCGIAYSGSEMLWIRRGGTQDENTAFIPWQSRWLVIPESIQKHAGSVIVLRDNAFHHFLQGDDACWRLHASLDSNGYRTEFTWSSDGHLKSVQDSAGRSYTLVYQQIFHSRPDDSGIRLLGVILANPNGPVPAGLDPTQPGLDWLVTYAFNDDGDLTEVRNRLGETARRFDWRDHIMVGHAQPDGLEIRYEWDHHTPAGKVLRQTERDGLTRDYRYLADRTEVTDNIGRKEYFVFEGEGGERRWVSHIRADGSRVEFTYDAFGRLTGFKDPLGRQGYARYDGQGRRSELVEPGKASTRYFLDDETGFVTGLRDADDRLWQLQRDERGNLLCLVDPTGAETRFEYGDPGLPNRATRIVDAKGGSRTLVWNRFGLLQAHTDCSANTTTFGYDDEGRLVWQQDPSGQRKSFSYDRLGRLTEVNLDAQTKIRYRHDRQGRVVVIEGAQQRSVFLSWDRFGRLCRVVDPAGTNQHYQYDVAGRLVEVNNENGTLLQMTYDVMDRRISERGFDGGVRLYGYDAVGNLLKRQESDGSIVRYEYDANDRLTSRHLPATNAAPAISEYFRWSPAGLLQSVTTPESHIRFHYDAAGRLIQENQWQGETWFYGIDHTLDPLGNRERSRYGDAPAVTWLLYGSGHLHGMLAGDLELAFERDAQHREIHRHASLRNGTQLFSQSSEYDTLNRLQGSALALPGRSSWVRRYAYDVHGHLVGVGDNQADDIRYAYDMRGRLLASRRGEESTVRYAFDPAGNRIDPHKAETLIQDNRLGRLDGHDFRYDAVGNLVECRRADGTHLQFAYDGAHRLVSLDVTDKQGRTLQARYYYDGLSRRIRKQVSRDGQVDITHYGWDGDVLCAEDDGSKRRTTIHLPNSFVPLARIEHLQHADSPEILAMRRMFAEQGEDFPGASRPQVRDVRLACFHTDHLGTPLRLSDDHNNLLWQAQSDDWAALRDEQGEQHQPIRFQGQYMDEESGLHYNRYRYYDPNAGRYLSQDPVGLVAGLHAYRYSEMPTQGIDPLGLWDFLVNSPGIQQQASLGMHMMKNGATPEQIAAAMKPQPNPIQGSLSLDGSLSGHGIGGGSVSLGGTVGKKGSDNLPNFCFYIMTCQTLGPGAAGGIGINGTASNAAPTTGQTYSVGGFGTGGFLGKFGGSVLSNINKPSEVSVTGGIGLGGGGAGGVMTCQQYQYCVRD